jgi:carbonic anhydrase
MRASRHHSHHPIAKDLMHGRLFAGLLFSVVAATGCGPRESGDGAEVADTAQTAPNAAPHWSYAGAEGPTAWNALSPEFATCGIGGEQSPIDVSSAVVDQALPHIALESGERAVSVVNNGHTLQANVADGGTLQLGDQAYRMIQFHYHVPSEHVIHGRPAAAEIHFVHRDSANKLAVVGLLLDEGTTANPLVDALPQGAALPQSDSVAAKVDPAGGLPSDHSYASYAGSLTTPPCSEGVKWIVLMTRGSLTRSQLAQLDGALGRNARPTMPVGARTVKIVSDPGM